MRQRPSRTAGIRLAELVAALSIATDLGMGQPMEYILRSCVLSVRLGETLGLSESELREVYYLAMLRYLGCNAGTHEQAALVGDELAMRTATMPAYGGEPSQIMNALVNHLRTMHMGLSSPDVDRVIAQILLSFQNVMLESAAGHCEVGQRLASRFGFGESMHQAIGQAYERWDGQGVPGGVKGEAIAASARIVSLAHDAVLFHRMGGVEMAVAVVKERAGGAHEPKIVERFCQLAPHLLAGLEAGSSWEAVLSLEPGEQTFLSEEQFDNACRAIADFTDLKSPYLLGHSSGVAELAAEAARRCGLPEDDIVAVWRAGMLHDVGRTGVSAGIWGKPGALSGSEWERVRLHSYYTERVLARPSALAQLGALAASHHERLDGSGYHRGVSAPPLPPTVKILAAADAYHAMTEPRPHRSALAPEAAAEELRSEVRAGRFDSEAANAVLAAAGHRTRSTRRALVAGLSEREVEVLRLLARGQSKKQIAELLFITEKTVSHHTQHIYTKIGVSTRAGATLFALQHDLLVAMG
ncbi:MAG: DNA-binding response regulator (narL) [Ktedonobacterales bacterium]|jgi:HD-GYP domain-containing protein (c-di-GMP phosphodiesterase class II)|nr:MAG: DNA-binding response regulator (narL) [Ktedonobacterales bacterium]